MTKFTTIPAGYRITVTSWENDGDNYNTKAVEGLDEEQVRLFVELCKLFDDDRNVSNLYEPADDEIDEAYHRIAEVARRHDSYIKFIGDAATDEEIAQHLLDGVLNEMGLSGTSEFFTRVCDDFTVEFVEYDITIPDVTAQFV